MSNNTLNLDEDSLNILAESMKDSWSDIKDLYSHSCNADAVEIVVDNGGLSSEANEVLENLS